MAWKLWGVCLYTVAIALCGIAIALTEIASALNSLADACISGGRRLGARAARLRGQPL